jgi:hypothetical protein
MTILVYGEKASRTHENRMLQTFLERLEDRWLTSTDTIIVVANTMWNGAEIDLVCILPSAILVADFKSHGGKLVGTENGPWQADGVLVKGGRKDNPYQQLRDNKFSVLDWLKSKSLLPGRNLGHISAGVVFAGSIDDQLDLPPKVRSWFYPTGLDRCATTLDGLASPELQIDRREALEIVQRLGAQPVEWSSTRPHVRDLGPKPMEAHGRTPLTAHQREALEALRNFLASDELVTFSVLGMTSTGKSRLLAEAASEIEKSHKKPIVLAPNRRLADRVPVKADSIYAHLYGTGEADNENDTTDEKSKPDVIPVRLCLDAADCVYLLDDSHLLGNSRFTTADGKQYGTGHLLDDFHAFTDLGSKSQRKAIFFGDPYQIQRAGDDESALSGEYQKARGLKHHSLELSQLVDTTGGSARLANAERLVESIRTERFAELDLMQDEGFRRVGKLEAAKQLLERFRSDPFSVWHLTETHAKASALTQWVRERLHGKKQLASLEVGDLLEIYVSATGSLPSGGRRLVAAVGPREGCTQTLKGRGEPIIFHSVRCTLEGENQGSLDLLEEFLVSEKPELSADTAIAERVWRKSRRADEQTPPAFTYARHGYASTVHHAQGMRQPICYVNCDHSAGRHSEGFFRWLYSALTVADRELVLVNFTDIHPFDAAAWNASAATVATNIAVGAGWSFLPNGIASEKDQQRSLPPGLDQSKDILKSVAIWLRVANAAEAVGWRVAKAVCHAYQEQYDLAGPEGEQCQLRIAYTDKNLVTAMHITDPAHWEMFANLASECFGANAYSAEANALLRSARLRLGRGGWKVVSAAEIPYRLTITAARNERERVSLEIYFDKQGLASSLRPSLTTDLNLLEEIKGALR